MARSVGMAGVMAALLLVGCGSSNKSVGGLSAEDAAQLDNDAEALDASPDGLGAPEGVQPANGAESTGGGDEAEAKASTP